MTLWSYRPRALILMPMRAAVHIQPRLITLGRLAITLPECKFVGGILVLMELWRDRLKGGSGEKRNMRSEGY
jgi:hypothetical protein